MERASGNAFARRGATSRRQNQPICVISTVTTVGPKNHKYEVNAMLRVAKASEDRIRTFFTKCFSIKANRVKSNFHLTVYHGRRPLPGLLDQVKAVQVTATTSETRLMVLAPGGENPRSGIDPRNSSVGIRLTKRNPAILEIQKLRERIYRLETRNVVGTRRRTTAWTNCFGSRNYQPHIQLLRPWHKLDATLTEAGSRFRSEIDQIDFDLFEIEIRLREDGQWVVATHPHATI